MCIRDSAKGVDAFPIRPWGVALGIPAKGRQIELRVAVENLLQLLGELRAILEPLAGGQFPDCLLYTSRCV